MLLDLVRERALERKAFQVDEKHGRESRKRERLGRFTQRFASWAVPNRRFEMVGPTRVTTL